MNGAASRIVVDPAVLAGKPIVAGTRLSVEFIIGLMADGWSVDEIIQNHPPLTADAIRSCLSYARDALRDETIFTRAA
jgi:uncharacterized protein (DUF433 family)